MRLAPILASIDVVQSRAEPLPAGALAFGDSRIDACLPGGSLPRGALHEVGAAGIEAETASVTAGFAACLLAGLGRAGGDLYWVAPVDDLHLPGLALYGLDPARIIRVATRDDAETLAMLEIILRAGITAAAVGEVGQLGPVQARRLQLACRRQGSTALALRRWPYGRRGPALGQANSAVTRWEVAAARSPGRLPAWRLRLLRARGGGEGGWLVQATGDRHAPIPLRVVTDLDAAASPPPPA